ncbi:hypothetical protein F5B22DRAFT_246287 [Xylaria bambusicola]|uniref:uncharacterized protein n=1 Tax=Xylaria bambusicola TaxID=326684 RepID=UPI00200746F1|nr:uncharacterized protein F5B22DRAFT_246287 [Xylaria bambusicola]KAI0513257.1 hypothetical protein F5B22DRAFT_246287 [Xylaria bambusicola]
MSTWSQFFPPKPNFSEIPPQDGKVFIVTGGASGIGFELSKALYLKAGRVYIAGRSGPKARAAIKEIEDSTPDKTAAGRLEFLPLELDDLASIKASVDEFKSKETKLHVLWNNAGVSRPPVGSKSKQGIELQLATNCLGPFLFTQLLIPMMQATALTQASESDRRFGSVRVVWTSSQSVELSAPTGGITMSELHDPPADATRLYNTSKAGNIFLASELARRHGIASVSTNPGASSTNLFRHTPYVYLIGWAILHDPKMAALTQIFAGLSQDISEADLKGAYIIPWGRVSANLRDDLREAMKLPEEGGSGRASEFWGFCEETTSKFL